MTDTNLISDLIAKGASSKVIADAVGVSQRRVQQLVRQNKLGEWKSKNPPKQEKRPVPDDFIANASVMSRNAIERLYKCGTQTAARWYKETSVVPPRLSGPQKAAPDNLAEMARTMTMTEIGKQLGVRRDAVRNMLRKQGIYKERKAPVAPPKPASYAIKKPMSSPIAPVNRYQRSMDLASQAADFLRKLGGVWRCDEKGAPDPDEKLWRRGNAILTDGDLIERATWKGFEPVGLGYEKPGQEIVFPHIEKR